MYFAAIGVINKAGKQYKQILLDETNSRQLYFVIWILNVSEIIKMNLTDFSIIRPIYTNNVNLKAQKGLFTTRPFISLEEDNIPLDQFIEKLPNPENKPLLYKIKIPQNKAYETLLYLDSQHVSAKNLFPGFKGVADYVKWIKNISHI